MLIDLGRNDVGRVCRTGSVKVTDTMVIERYSHVMHIVSQVEGDLADGLTATDAIRSAFPAGTLSGRAQDPGHGNHQRTRTGAPQRLRRRGRLHLNWHDDADLAIAIRTAVIKDGMLHVQAGAGIVADSDPEKEWEETMNKGRALIAAVNSASMGSVMAQEANNMILMIDNYDSFTYNLVQYLGELGAEVETVRNDAVSVADIIALKPEGHRDFAGALHAQRGGHLPGGGAARWARRIRSWACAWVTSASARPSARTVVRAERIMHGKTSMIYHRSQGVFAGLPQPFEATRYHSLVLDPDTIPESLVGDGLDRIQRRPRNHGHHGTAA